MGTFRVDPPAGRAPRAGLVVVQEIFGVNDHVRAVAEGFAAEGYAVAAPALFDDVEVGVELGYSADDIVRGRALRTEVGNDRALALLGDAVRAVSPYGKVGMVGYCWGGLLTWLAAAGVDGLSAAVPYYGTGIVDRADLPVRCPVMLHFGARDASIPLAAVEGMAARRADVTVHVYDADHGFNCDRRAAYHAPSADLARERTLAFLARHLG